MATKLFVGSIAFSATDDELKAHFEQAGTVVSAKIITDRETGRSRGFGFVEFATEDEAKAAVDKLNNSDLAGRNIVVSEARAKN